MQAGDTGVTCAVPTVTPNRYDPSADGGTITVTATASDPSCPLDASVNKSFLHVPAVSRAAGSLSADITITVDANGGGWRDGHVNIRLAELSGGTVLT